MKIRLWQATTLGGLAGLILGVGLELARQLRGEYATQKMVAEFESRGMSPPLMTDMLRPQVIPVVSCFLAALIFSLVHIWWQRR